MQAVRAGGLHTQGPWGGVLVRGDGTQETAGGGAAGALPEDKQERRPPRADTNTAPRRLRTPRAAVPEAWLRSRSSRRPAMSRKGRG